MHQELHHSVQRQPRSRAFSVKLVSPGLGFFDVRPSFLVDKDSFFVDLNPHQPPASQPRQTKSNMPVKQANPDFRCAFAVFPSFGSFPIQSHFLPSRAGISWDEREFAFRRSCIPPAATGGGRLGAPASLIPAYPPSSIPARARFPATFSTKISAPGPAALSAPSASITGQHAALWNLRRRHRRAKSGLRPPVFRRLIAWWESVGMALRVGAGRKLL